MNRGFITLITIIIVAALGLTLSLAVLFNGIDTTLSSEVRRNGVRALAFADACIESALQAIADSTPYTGSDGLGFGNAGSCSYTVTSQGGQNRTIEATGTSGGAVRKIRVQIDQVNPSLSVSQYLDVSDF